MRKKVKRLIESGIAMKQCTKCDMVFPLEMFRLCRASPDGKRAECWLCHDEHSKEYYQRTKAKHLLISKQWREKNKDRKYPKYSCPEKKAFRYKQDRLARYKKIRETPELRMRENLRSRIRIAVIRNYKASSTRNLIGCSVAELRKHIEAQWVLGMNWDNYGAKGWHIDHIKPIASFDLSDPAQQLECFNFKNLQPLWARDNLIKSDKWIPTGGNNYGI